MATTTTSSAPLLLPPTSAALTLLVPDAAKAVATQLAAMDKPVKPSLPPAAVAAAVAAVKAATLPVPKLAPSTGPTGSAPVTPVGTPVTPVPSAMATTPSGSGTPTKPSAKPYTSANAPPGAVISPREPGAKTTTAPPLAARKPLPKTPTAAAVAAALALTSTSKTTLPRPASPSPASVCATPAAQVVSAFTFPQPTIQPPVSMPPHAVVSTSTTAKRTISGASNGNSKPKQPKGNTGRWTEAEHKLFLKGLEQFPYRAWKKIATLIKTRTVVQIRTHAQKYYQKLEKEEQRLREREAQAAAQQGLAAIASEARARTANANTAANAATASAANVNVNATAAAAATSAALAALAATNALAEDALFRKKPVLRKRKFAEEAAVSAAATAASLVPVPLPLPAKRILREKKVLREKTMSPKQKVVLASAKTATTTGLFDLLAPRSSKTLLQSLDADEAEAVTTSLVLDLNMADDKALAEFPFAGAEADGIEQTLGIDSEDLLQLTDADCLDWFADEQDDLLPGSGEDEGSPASSPLTLGRQTFQQLCPPLDSADLELALDDDEDFVLDPEKFLSTYFTAEA